MKKVMDLSAKAMLLKGEPCVKIKYIICPATADCEVTIYRREEKNYNLRECTGEYFDGMLPTKEDVIFKGFLKLEHGLAEYTDCDVEIGKIYVYWVGRSDIPNDVCAPVPVKIRDPYFWWSFENILKKTEELATTYPDVEVLDVGKTVAHKPLKTIIAGNKENLIALVGAVHAGESGPELLLTVLENLLKTSPQLLKKVGVAVLPSVNADSREMMVEGLPWYLRKNKNGVDLNRNFDCDWEKVTADNNYSTAYPESATYRGLYPNSEPETQAVINMVKTLKPKMVMAYHWLSSVTADSALSSQKAFSDKNTEFIKRVDIMTRIYSDAFRDEINFKRIEGRRTNYGDCLGGSFVTWLYSQNIVGVDFEAWDEWNQGILKGADYDLTTREQFDICVKCHTAAIKAILDSKIIKTEG